LRRRLSRGGNSSNGRWPNADSGEATGARVVGSTDRINEIEDALTVSKPETLDDVQGILGVVLKNMDEEDAADRDMLRTAHQGLNRIRNKTGETPPGEPAAEGYGLDQS
jgi:hypothetical protein